jgi:hypothetical protein
VQKVKPKKVTIFAQLLFGAKSNNYLECYIFDASTVEVV